MCGAISGYWKLSKKYGLIKAIKYFYSWYYGQYKQKGVDLGSERIIDAKNGCKLHLIPNDPGISLELTRFGIHEPVTTQIVQEKIKKGMVCLDCGGNIGYYATLESNLVGKEGRVIAIEPSPVNFQYLQKNLELQGQENYEVYNLACGKEDDEITFVIHKISNMCRVAHENEQESEDKKLVKIPMRKLDTFLSDKKIDRLDLLRMDIEGSELKLFQGALETLRKFKPMIQMELHPGHLGPENTKKVLELLSNEGYEFSTFMIGYLDTPLVGTKRDIKNYKIKDLIRMIDEDIHPKNILLFLENTKTKN